MNKPFISVIIPTFNSETTFSKCLESLLVQTFKNFEILHIDGNSTDATLSISEQYKIKFENYISISEKDKGVYDAMNKGVGLAKGQWLYFLGSDDTIVNKNVFAEIVDELKADNQLEVLYGNVNSHFHNRIYDGEFTFSRLIRVNICHQAIFIKKSVFLKIGMFNLKYVIAADWDHNIKWFFNKNIKYKYTPITVANFADGGLSTSEYDHNFLNDVNFKFLKVGYNQLNYLELRRLCKIELEKLKANFKLLKFIYLNTYMLVIKLRRKILN